MMIDLVDYIDEYIDHLEDGAYFGLIDHVPVADLIDTLVAMLRADDERLVSSAGLFIRDLALAAPPDGIRAAFRAAFPGSRLTDTLEELVQTGDLVRQLHATYTLGKIGHHFSAPILRAVLQAQADENPLIIVQMLGEYLWLVGRDWELVEELCSRPHYLTRWAALEGIGRKSWPDEPTEPAFQQRLALLQRLHADPHPLVGAQAIHKALQMHARFISKEFEKGEQKRIRRALRASEPPITFLHVEIRFRNYLREQGKSGYTRDELEQFAQTLTG